MTTAAKPSPAAIRRARSDNPKMRERDLAASLGISEAELVAAFCGEGSIRVEPHYEKSFPGLQEVGEIMALTRNESCVHEKIGVFEKFSGGQHAGIVLGEEIDLRMFPNHWKHAFAVEKRDGDELRRSLQFFDARGDAVFKVHTRAGTDLAAWQKLIDSLVVTDQSQSVEVSAPAAKTAASEIAVPVQELRERWSRMTDTHEFALLLRAMKLPRHTAVSSVGEDYAWPVDNSSVVSMMEQAAADALPIMCFVGSRGCIQIHSGPIETVKMMGPWANVMDPTFHLHLRTDHIATAWAVRKPTDMGHVTSVEAYDSNGELIIQFFGKRIEGQDERPAWRQLVENLPRPQSRAA